MFRLHPAYGELVVSDARIDGGRWIIRNAQVALSAVLDMIEDGCSTEEFLMRHILILRSDLVEITMLYALIGRSEASA